MRRLLSILLLLAFGLPMAVPLIAATDSGEAGLPACCRRNGKHHCMMSAAQRERMMDHAPRFQAPVEQCPYCPASFIVAHTPSPADLPSGWMIFAQIVSHPAAHAQTASLWRISRDRSRRKRGPPTA